MTQAIIIPADWAQYVNVDAVNAITEDRALDVATSFLIDQSGSAREVLEDECWKPAAYIVAFLCQSYPSIIEPLNAHWDAHQEKVMSTKTARINNLRKEPLLIGAAIQIN